MIQQIAVEHRRRYGSLRIAAELRRRGMVVNRKKVVRIMRLAVEKCGRGSGRYE